MINLKTVDKLAQKIITTLKRFPISSFCAFIFTIIIVSLIELEPYTKNNEIIIATKVALVASLGIFLFPALKLFWSNSFVNIIGIGILIGYYYILPYDITDNENIFFRHTILIISTFLMYLWGAFINVKISNKNIWEWTQNFILIITSTILFSFILYIGISLALYAIESLFNIDIPSKRYAQVAVIVFGIYGVNLFLSQIPRYILLLQARTYTKAEEIFTKYILTPLMIGYFFIIFAYSIKILITMEWPSGVVAWISLIFSIIAISTYLFWTPLWDENNSKFKKAIWIAILIETIMLGVSIWLRIDEYGITENRYFISLFGVWLVLMSLYFLFIKNASYKWLFISLTILLLASQFGKYSATNISRENQLTRLQNILDSNITKAKNLNEKSKENIYNTIDYLYNHHGLKSLKKVIPDIVKEYQENNTTKTKYYFTDFAVEKLGIKDIKNKRVFIMVSKPRDHINIQGYKELIFFDEYNIELQDEKNGDIQLKDNNLTIIKNNKKVVTIDLTQIIKSIDYNKKRVSLPQNKMEYIYTDDKVKVKLLFKSIVILDSNIESVNCYILTNIK